MARRSVLLLLTGVVMAAAAGYWFVARDRDSSSSPPVTAAERTEMSGLRSDLGVGNERAEDGTRTQPAPVAAKEPTDARRYEAETVKLLEDASGTIQAALALPSGDARRNQLMRIGRAWARTAPREAWQHASQLADPAARRAFQDAVLMTWAAEHPEEALVAVAELPADWQRDQLLRQVVTGLAVHDGKRAIELLNTVEVADRDAFHALIVETWSRYDPSSAALWAEGQDRRLQGRLAFPIAEAYVSQQPAEALAWALRISRSPERNLWSYMLGRMAVWNPQEALRLAQAAENPRQRHAAIGSVLSSIAARDPGLAISELEKLPAGRARARASVRIAMAIGETAPAAAIDWLASLEDPQARLEGLANLGASLARQDVGTAALLLDRVPEDSRHAWIQNVAGAYVQSDVAKGIEWVRRFQEDPQYRNILGEFAVQLAASNPDAAIELVDRSVVGKERDQILADMVTMTGRTLSPEIAARWVSRISDESAKGRAIDSVAGGWAYHEPSAAHQWVMSLQAGPTRDRGLVRFVSVAKLPVDELLSAIGQIQSQEQRSDAVMRAAMRMSRDDPEGARTLLRRHPLDPVRQQQFDNQLKQQGRAGS